MILLLGNMLFPHHAALPIQRMPVFMAEDGGLCSHFRYHKHKLMLVLAAMRHHRDFLREQGVTVEYWELEPTVTQLSYEEKLRHAIIRHNTTALHTYTIEDQGFGDRLRSFCHRYQVQLICHDSPLFLTTPAEFQTYQKRYKRLFMGDFYKFQRQRLNILLDESGKPEGGKWSYDDQNRQKLPKALQIPTLTLPSPTEHVKAVGALVDQMFPDHPGQSRDFWLPVTHTDTIAWLNQFLTERFIHFGPYEDALSTQHAFTFHSVLSPMLNLGIITPAEVLDAALTYAAENPVPLNSLEGFVRQLIGWREYIRGVYHAIAPQQRQTNALNHSRKLSLDWYKGTTGLVPVDHVIQQVQTRGWAHHIERLMVISNAMLLAEVHPDEVFRWFMELFVDSADWVMVPNVYGMGQFADGGQMMTKPYTSGSNYLLKMGHYPKGEWCDVWDGLYWRFVDRKRDLLTRNPRAGMMVKTLDKMDRDRQQKIFAKAETFIQSKTALDAIF